MQKLGTNFTQTVIHICKTNLIFRNQVHFRKIKQSHALSIDKLQILIKNRAKQKPTKQEFQL